MKKNTPTQPDDIRRRFEHVEKIIADLPETAALLEAKAEEARRRQMVPDMRSRAASCLAEADEIDHQLTTAPPANTDAVVEAITRRDALRRQAEALEIQVEALRGYGIADATRKVQIAKGAMCEKIIEITRREIADTYGPSLEADLRRVTECSVALSAGLGRVCQRYDTHVPHTFFDDVVPVPVNTLRQAIEAFERRRDREEAD